MLFFPLTTLTANILQPDKLGLELAPQGMGPPFVCWWYGLGLRALGWSSGNRMEYTVGMKSWGLKRDYYRDPFPQPLPPEP